MKVRTSEALTPVSTKQSTTCPHRCRRNADRKARMRAGGPWAKGGRCRGRRQAAAFMQCGGWGAAEPRLPPEPDGPAPCWVFVKKGRSHQPCRCHADSMCMSRARPIVTAQQGADTWAAVTGNRCRHGSEQCSGQMSAGHNKQDRGAPQKCQFPP